MYLSTHISAFFVSWKCSDCCLLGTLQHSRNAVSHSYPIEPYTPVVAYRNPVSWAWGEGLLSKVLSSQAQGPEFYTEHPHKEPGTPASIPALRSQTGGSSLKNKVECDHRRHPQPSSSSLRVHTPTKSSLPVQCGTQDLPSLCSPFYFLSRLW